MRSWKSRTVVTVANGKKKLSASHSGPSSRFATRSSTRTRECTTSGAPDTLPGTRSTKGQSVQSIRYPYHIPHLDQRLLLQDDGAPGADLYHEAPGSAVTRQQSHSA